MQHNSYEMIRIGSQNLLRELAAGLSQMLFHCSWVQLALSITVTCTAVLLLVYRIGRPAQASLLPMLNVFNIVKSSRRGRSDESTAGQEKKRLDQGAQQVQDKQETLMPDLKPANYMPGEDVEEWLHFFEQYVERYDKRSWATSLLLSLDKTCHQHGKFGYRDSYDELKEKLMTTFAKPEVRESNKTLKACSDSLDEFVQRQRRDDETAVQFLGALEELGQQALSTMAEEMREKHIKSHFMKGINNDDLKSDVLRTMAQTDESCITVTRLKEIVGNYDSITKAAQFRHRARTSLQVRLAHRHQAAQRVQPSRTRHPKSSARSTSTQSPFKEVLQRTSLNSTTSKDTSTSPADTRKTTQRPTHKTTETTTVRRFNNTNIRSILSVNHQHKSRFQLSHFNNNNINNRTKANRNLLRTSRRHRRVKQTRHNKANNRSTLCSEHTSSITATNRSSVPVKLKVSPWLTSSTAAPVSLW